MNLQGSILSVVFLLIPLIAVSQTVRKGRAVSVRQDVTIAVTGDIDFGTLIYDASGTSKTIVPHDVGDGDFYITAEPYENVAIQMVSTTPVDMVNTVGVTDTYPPFVDAFSYETSADNASWTVYTAGSTISLGPSNMGTLTQHFFKIGATLTIPVGFTGQTGRYETDMIIEVHYIN